MTEQFYEVALPRPLRRQFTYSFAPNSEISTLKPGTVVTVPFGRNFLRGVVTGKALAPSQELLDKIKPIGKIESIHPHFSNVLLDLTRWISDYYLSSWGEALSNALPTPSKKNEELKSTIPLQYAASFSKTLTSDQQKALEFIHQKSGEKKPFLIYGVTGSGKTEIYLRLAEEVLKEGKSVVYLVPEIALMDQIRFFIEESFPNQVALFHSRQTPKERLSVWNALKQGEKRFVLGPRSALFAPVANVGLIIMDEEHDDSYKQDETPRYHSRLVAWKRAELEGAVFILGSATPSLEILEAVKESRAHLIRLENRISEAALPHIQLVDLKREKRDGAYYLSETLKGKIQDRLTKKEGTLLFLNRRGFSTQVSCRSCGYFSVCNHCDVALTYHQEQNKLICHYCGFAIIPPPKCPACEKALSFKGFGTEKVESEIARIFPGAVIERLDRDTVQKRGNLEMVLDQFRKGEIDILIGTQMLSKGLDFKRLTLVGVLSADGNLQLPDFRGSERAYQLLEQVSGRSGRGEIAGEVILQTFLPDHYSIRAVVERKSQKFIDKELEHRRQWNYPPFVQMMNLTLRGREEKPTIQAAEALKIALDQLIGGVTKSAILQEGGTFSNASSLPTEVIGPAPLPFYRLRGYFRWHIMVKGKDLSDFKKRFLNFLEKNKLSPSVYLEIDVDPIQIL